MYSEDGLLSNNYGLPGSNNWQTGRVLRTNSVFNPWYGMDGRQRCSNWSCSIRNVSAGPVNYAGRMIHTRANLKLRWTGDDLSGRILG
jgi:hypothetical protein